MRSTLVVRPAVAGSAPFDLRACEALPHLRELVLLPGARVTGLTALTAAPELRELVLSSSSCDATELLQLLPLPRLQQLHLNGFHLLDADLAEVAAGTPALRRLVLHRVTGLSGGGVAALQRLTQLRLSETQLRDAHEVSAAPRLRRLEVTGVRLPDLRLLAARSLVDVDVDAPAADEAGLAELLAGRTRLRTFHYPLRDPALLVGCTGLQGLTLHGGGRRGEDEPWPDLAVLRHLPVRAVHVLCAPSRERAEGLLARAAVVWPDLVQTGWHEDWG